MELSNLVKNITPSKTLAITAKANELKTQGVSIIGLGAGEPDFNTPEEIIEAAYQAMRNGKTKYTIASGINELKDKAIEKYKNEQNLNYDRSEVFIGNGAKHVLYNLFLSILSPGDEVLIPSPFWVSYPEQVKLAQGTPKFIQTREENEFKLSKELLEHNITNKTKAIVLNSPNNPTGMVYSKGELEEIASVLEDKEIIIISDEIYDTLIYENTPVSIAQLSKSIQSKTIIVNGVSKSHAMTGWRIGYALGDAAIIKAMSNISSHSTSNPTSISQWAAVQAYDMDPLVVQEMRSIFKDRRDRAYERLVKIPHVSCIKPDGAFYLLPNFKTVSEKCGFSSVDEFVSALLEEAHVAVVPGSSFGVEDNIRMSYALSTDDMLEALNRIEKFIESHLVKE